MLASKAKCIPRVQRVLCSGQRERAFWFFWLLVLRSFFTPIRQAAAKLKIVRFARLAIPPLQFPQSSTLARSAWSLVMCGR